MKTIVETVKSGSILVSDGAWGTFLHKKGLEPGQCPELWCITRKNDVLDIAKSYAGAGADMIESNSFGANRFKLIHYGLEARAREMNRAAAAISREAAGPNRHVIASVGPTGKILMMGDVTEEEIYGAFKEQAVALEEGGADACCIETMTALDEACIAVKAARENTRLEVICTFTFDKTVDNTFRTMMGVSPAEMAAALVKAGAHVIGTNCGNGMERMVEIVREIRAADKATPVLVHANAGLPQAKDGQIVYPETPEMMAGLVPAIVSAGANIVGGCCGTTPEHIAKIVAAVKSIRK
ncbi:MAG TPA: homocysteine S-methyltransferase family protein [Chitinivibrionales bacterium]|nr:homocysteine S-methyltransferase family protein [Chitinivibrionales bacterium]